ncbi:mechanosensitive ion channel family protein [Secundilactobacillus kimchicus]|uniref:mechanosensitive ion channel family protein n=1 Tax=Secundilactobacillus kimchicus TaxID=528209 RepID=UPI0024A9AA99|nr:mechanosensitive ion channel family protein [Secundilactobacillus kimchicus]
MNQQLNQMTLQHLFRHFNWEKMSEQFLSTIGQLAIVTIALVVISTIGQTVIKHSFNRYKRTRLAGDSGNRIDTIYTLIMNLFHYTILFFWIYALLSAMGVPVGTLIAGAGIFSLALGLGAQGFVSDIVNGAFMLMEKQIDVGDTVRINQIEGTVSAIGIRTTQIVSYDGTLNFIPNRNITIVSNMSRHEMRAMVEIPIFPDSPIDQISAIIETVNTSIKTDLPAITKAPTLLGTTPLTNGKLAIQVVTFTQPGEQANAQRELLTAYLKALSQANIPLPTPYPPESTAN